MSETTTLRCPSCGAPAAAEASACAHCRVELHPVRCPWCFAWTFEEARDCGRCGSVAAAAPAPASCPSCREPLSARTLGKATMSGCARCEGVWIEPESFRAICADRESQTAYLGEGMLALAPKTYDPQSSPIVYRPCAVCGELMNRFNFADRSGVILDACKPHGVWFDADELRRIVAFIREGGLEDARARERRRLEQERRKRELAAEDARRPSDGFRPPVPDSVASARDLLRFFLDAK